MKQELKFKTNIQCMGCISTVTPVLNAIIGEGNWEVDIQSPEKPLTVKGEDLPVEKMVEALAKVGYKAVAV